MNFKIFNILFILLFFFSSNVSSKIEERIVAKIGNEIITKYDIFNEINTILALSNISSSQGEIANLQGIAFKSLTFRDLPVNFRKLINDLLPLYCF